jgi:hypothetical protein
VTDDFEKKGEGFRLGAQAGIGAIDEAVAFRERRGLWEHGWTAKLTGALEIRRERGASRYTNAPRRRSSPSKRVSGGTAYAGGPAALGARCRAQSMSP